MNLQRLENETAFEYKLRLCLAKLDKKTDLTWAQIAELVGDNISSEMLRHCAYGYKEYEDNMFYGGVKTRILSISDLHVPFQKPISVYESFAGKVDILQINGDLLDCSACSKFTKTYRQSPIEEMIVARQHVLDLVELIRPKKIVVNYGNHELRQGNYLAKQLDNELQELMPETAFDYLFTDGFTHYNRKTGQKSHYEPLSKVFENENIECEYTNKWYSVIGSVVFAHPKTFSTAILKTAEKALYWFRNQDIGKISAVVMAHTHRQGQYKIGKTVIYEQGACCETQKMSYSDGMMVNSQKEGFIFVCLDENGDLVENKTRLVSLN